MSSLEPTLSQPKHYFRNVKKIHVIENVDYYTRCGSTTIVVHYKAWWKVRRKLKFFRVPTDRDGAETFVRSPEAQAVINKLKENLRPSHK